MEKDAKFFQRKKLITSKLKSKNFFLTVRLFLFQQWSSPAVSAQRSTQQNEDLATISSKSIKLIQEKRLTTPAQFVRKNLLVVITFLPSP